MARTRLQPQTLKAVGVDLDDLTPILGCAGVSLVKDSKQRSTSMADSLSVWEVCDIVKDSGFCTISSAVDRVPPEPEGSLNDLAMLEDLRKARAALSEDRQEEESSSHVFKGFWRPDGGLGSAANPQLQMTTKRLSLVKVELRAHVGANMSLEVWLLGGTVRGEAVKQLAAREQEEGAPKPQGRIYPILASAHSVTQKAGPLRVLLECEVPRAQTLTLLLARGSYGPAQAEVRAEVKAEAPARQDTVSVESLRRLSASRLSLEGDATPRRRRMSRRPSQGSELGSEAPRRRGSVRKQSVLPSLSVQVEAPEEKPSEALPSMSLVPDVLLPQSRALVRGWSCEDDHYELRIWSTCPVKSPLMLTEPKKRVQFEDLRWQQEVQGFRKSFEGLEDDHEEFLWQMRAESAWSARVALNGDLDVVEAELRALRQQPMQQADIFACCRAWRQGFTLLDCVGKELGTSGRLTKTPFTPSFLMWQVRWTTGSKAFFLVMPRPRSARESRRFVAVSRPQMPPEQLAELRRRHVKPKTYRRPIALARPMTPRILTVLLHLEGFEAEALGHLDARYTV